MEHTYTTVKNLNPFHKSTKHESILTTAYESISRSYILQLCFGSVLLVICYFIYRWRKNGRFQVGPKCLPVLGCICDLSSHYNQMHDWLLSFLLRSHTICVPMPFGRIYYCTVEPRNVKHLLESNSLNFRKSQGFFERMEVLLGQKDLHESRVMRKWVDSEFSKPSLCNLSAALLKKKTCTIARLLSQIAYEGKIVDIQDLLRRATLDAIGKVAFGVDFASLPSTLARPWPCIEFATALDSATATVVKRFIDPLWKLKRYLNIGLEGLLPKQMEAVDGFVFRVISDRKAELKHIHGQLYDLAQAEPEGTPYTSDLVSKFLNLTIKDENANIAQPDEMLRHIVMNFVMASRDAIAVTLTWFVYQMSQHPIVAYKLYEELRGYHQRRRLDGECSLDQAWDVQEEQTYLSVMDTRIRDFAALLSSHSLEELPYLHACVQETFRLHPMVPLDPRDIQEDDRFPAGEVPIKRKKGNMVFLSPYAMARLNSIWGSGASTFNPDRWLQNGKIVPEPDHDYKFVTFQAGLYTAVVKDLTYQNCKIAAAILGRFFEFIYASPLNNRPPQYRMASTLLLENGLQVYARLRD